MRILSCFIVLRNEVSWEMVWQLRQTRHPSLTSSYYCLLEVQVRAVSIHIIDLEWMINRHFAVKVLIVCDNHVMVLKFLVDCEMLHPGCLIYQVDMGLLLFLSVVVYIRLSLQRHSVGLGLELLVHLLKR